jgi:hypothetical protein
MYLLKKYIGVILLIFLISFSWLSFQQLRTTEPRLPGYSQNSYSAYRSIEYLKQIAKKPHSGGTNEHKRIRNYIFDFCKKLGFTTKVLNQTGLRQSGSNVVVGNAYNILVKVKGSNSDKAVLVMSHYDSQPNAVGAADDGSGVASMLECLSLLKNKNTLKNDVYFLFTDLEETGLFGAEAFVHANEELQNIGLILNYEGRGNSGANFTFETSSDNGWVIEEYNKAVDRPLANALAYEIYKLMPNDTDFSTFKNTEIAGLNTAFIDGFSYYHSGIDTPANMNIETLQQQGDLMWDMINHFGSLDLSQTKSEDVIFFTLFDKMIIYPTSWDWPLILIACLLFGASFYFGMRDEKLSPYFILKGFVSYVLILVVSMLIVWLFNKLVLVLNQHYSNFYNYNFYNATTYLWTVIGVCLLVFGVINRVVFKSVKTDDKLMGALLLQIVLLFTIKAYLPTGSFILYVPLISTLGLILISFISHKDIGFLKSFFIPILPLILWIPFIYFLFVVFSLSLPFASALFLILLLPYLYPAADYLKYWNNWFITGLGALTIITSLIIGQLSSDISKEHPLQSQLAYAISLDINEAFWISPQKHKDDFVNSYITSDDKQTLKEIYPSSNRVYWKADAPLLNVSNGKITIVSDTIVNDLRQLDIKITPGFGVTYFNLFLPENAFLTAIDGRSVENNASRNLYYYAPASSGANVSIISASAEPLQAILVESKMEIPDKLLIRPLPEDYIFGTGSMSNNVLIKKSFNL